MSKRYTILGGCNTRIMSQTYGDAILGKRKSQNIIIILGFTFYRTT
nr:MAG TPA: hypothetical protein [Caudoviricetes sp.]